MSVVGGWFIFQAVTVNYSLAFLFVLVLAIFAGLKVIQHYDSGTEYRINNKYTWLELSAIVFTTGLIIALSGHMLI
jgi:hypothetical protein